MTKILVLSDFHCGSKAGLMPEEAEENTPNKNQWKLLDIYNNMVQDVGAVDWLILNGDVVSGVNRNGRGIGMWTTDINLQQQCVVDLVKKIKKINKGIIVTEGSIYHSDVNPNSDRSVADRLRCTFHDKNVKFGIESTLNLRQEGKRFYFRHFIGGASANPSAKAAVIAREMMDAIMFKEQYKKINKVVFSHRHAFIGVNLTDIQAMITPCWELKTPFAARRKIGYVPEIGYILFHVNGSIEEQVESRKVNIIPTLTEVEA